MEKKTIDYLKMESVDNGVIISYTEKCEKMNSTFENASWKERKEVFDIKSEKDLIEASKRFMEIINLKNELSSGEEEDDD